MRKAGVAHSKSSKDMESHVFLKAKTRVRPCWPEGQQSSSRRSVLLILNPSTGISEKGVLACCSRVHLASPQHSGTSHVSMEKSRLLGGHCGYRPCL